jgi:hypothetical protein
MTQFVLGVRYKFPTDSQVFHAHLLTLLTYMKVPYTAADGHTIITQTLLARLPGTVDENPVEALFKFSNLILEVTEVRRNSARSCSIDHVSGIEGPSGCS